MSREKWHVFFTSLAFVIGFSLVFTLLGASATSIGSFLRLNKLLFARVAGVVVILLGLHLSGLLRISFLYREKRLQVTRKPPGMPGAFLMGLAFAFGWTPCIGPFLGAALTLAAQKETVAQGMSLLFLFSLGLGIPFLLTSLAIGTFFQAFGRIKKHFHLVEVVGGALLVFIGVLMVTGSFTSLARLASRFEVTLGPGADHLTLVSAFVAGLLAFLSPCVLPLIPGYISYVSGVSLQELQKPAS